MVWWRTSGAVASALAAAPIALAALALRPGLRVGLRERLGGGPETGPEPAPGAVWVHAASVGESLAALRLVDALQARGRAVAISTTTPTGRAVVRAARASLPVQLAPLDHPLLVARALDRVRPLALVLVETELWPSWIAAASRRRIPVIVVSARLSDRSFPRYRRLARWLAPTLHRLSAVGARTSEDALRFAALGVASERITVTGDLKLEAPASAPRLADDLSRALGRAALFVAGSTHAGEEEAALAALAQAEAAGARCALVLAPRHPERADDVARRVIATGRRLLRRSTLGGATLRAGDVLLLDGLGELAALWTRASLAFVGGTLAPVGGHNLLEPVQLGRPVVFGPFTANVRAAEDLALASGAGARVADSAALANALMEALREPERALARAARGRDALGAHRGAAERSAALIDAALAAALQGCKAEAGRS